MLAGQQGADLGRYGRHGGQLDSLEAWVLAAARPDGGLRTHAISLVAREHDAVARTILIRDEPIRPGPDGLGDGATWRRLSQPPGHDHRYHSSGLCQGIEHEPERLAQYQPKPA